MDDVVGAVSLGVVVASLAAFFSALSSSTPVRGVAPGIEGTDFAKAGIVRKFGLSYYHILHLYGVSVHVRGHRPPNLVGKMGVDANSWLIWTRG